MVFSLDFDKPSKEEIIAARKMATYNPEDLDSRELWVLENFSVGDDDE